MEHARCKGGALFDAARVLLPHRRAFLRLGDVAATICPCEQFTDTALNIESRLDKVDGNFYTVWELRERADRPPDDACRSSKSAARSRHAS